MALPQGFLDDLRARVPISQIVGRRVSWHARKSNPARGDLWACCPFHEEKSPSFHVDDRKGFYKCFGCGASGDAVTFLRERENMSFMEAVTELARAAGVEMPAENPQAAARAERAQGLVHWMEAAARFYRVQLAGGRAQAARAYIEGRGLSAQTQERFGLGYAPGDRRALLDHLTAQGAAVAALAEAGLVGVPEDGGAPYDRFRDRIMFPIRDARGRCIAFGARAIHPGQEPKYLNSPETPLFDKSRTLFNVGPAREAAGRAGALVVVEGYMDVIALVQAGIDHAVAPLGTAVTETHLELMWRLCPEPVLAMDGDGAGLRAARRVIDLALPLLGPGRSLRFALLPPGQDPDDLVRGGGAAAMQAVLDRAEPLVAVLWQREIEGRVFDSPERRAALDAALRASLARIADPGLRGHYRDALAERRAALFGRGRAEDGADEAGRRRGPSGRPRKAGGSAGAGPLPLTCATPLARGLSPDSHGRGREAVILVTLLRHPALLDVHGDAVAAMSFAHPDLDALRRALLHAYAETPALAHDAAGMVKRVAALCPEYAVDRIEAEPMVRASRWARSGGTAEAADAGLRDLLARPDPSALLLSETRLAVDSTLGSTADDESYVPRRALADRVWREHGGQLPESRADDEAIARELRDAVTDEIWIKRKRGRRPNQ